jgi:hypothetical protein
MAFMISDLTNTALMPCSLALQCSCTTDRPFIDETKRRDHDDVFLSDVARLYKSMVNVCMQQISPIEVRGACAASCGQDRAARIRILEAARIGVGVARPDRRQQRRGA